MKTPVSRLTDSDFGHPTHDLMKAVPFNVCFAELFQVWNNWVCDANRNKANKRFFAVLKRDHE